LIAQGKNKYTISLIDRYDDLGDLLCDENYILRIEVNYDSIFPYEKIEQEIKSLLKR
jgi:hypothetical protein